MTAANAEIPLPPGPAGGPRAPARWPALAAGIFVLALALRALGIGAAAPTAPAEQALLDAATPGITEAPDVPGAATAILRGLRRIAPAPAPAPGLVEGLPPLPDPALRLARGLGALLAALAAALAARTAAALGGRRAGAAAGLLLAVGAFEVSLAWGRGPLLLAASAGLLSALATRGVGSPGALGAWAGLAAAAGGGGGVALLAGAPAGLTRFRGWLIALAAGLAVFAVAGGGFAGLVPDLPDDGFTRVSAGSPLAAGARALARGIGWPALVLAFAGAWRVLRRGDRTGAAILAATAAAALVSLLRVGPAAASLAVALPGAAILAGLGVGAPRGGRDRGFPAPLARAAAVIALIAAGAITAGDLAARYATPPAERAAEWIRRNLPNGAPFLLEEPDVLVATPRGLRALTDLAGAGQAPRAVLEEYARGSKTFRPVPLPPAGVQGREAALFYDPNLALFFPWMILRDTPPPPAAPAERREAQRMFHEYFLSAWTEVARFPAGRGRAAGLVVLQRPDSVVTVDRERLAPLGVILAGESMMAVRDSSAAFTGWLRDGGEALMSGAQIVGALGFLEVAASRDSTDAEIFHRLAQAYLLHGRAADAKSASLTGLAIDPFHGGIHYNLAVALEAEGDLDGAETEYRAAIAQMAEPSVAHARLGGVLLARGDVAGARAELDTVRRLAPGEEADRYLTGVLGDP